MLDYTKAALAKTKDDFRKMDYFRNLVTQILYLVYLVYALLVKAGIWWANLTLLTLSAAYLVFFLIVTAGGAQNAKRKTRKIVARIFTRCKQLIKLYTLGVMVYGIYATTSHVTPLSVVLSALMIVGWILQIVFEVVLSYFLRRAQLILDGMEADYENLIKPAKTVGNFFKKLAGKEIPPQKERSKNKLWLDKKVAENREEKKRQKSEKRNAKKQAKTDAKNTVFLPQPPPQQLPMQDPPLQEMPSHDEPPLLTE